MYKIEKKLNEQLVLLKEKYGLKGIKAEFEAEGSSFNDILRLRRLTLQAGVKLYLKIGGVEAVRDIKDSLELGVDGLIAPMVESSFGAKKFLEAYGKVYGDHRVHLTLNIETKNAIKELDDILKFSKGKIDTITIGRTDLSGSYLDDKIIPDTPIILENIKKAAQLAKKYDIDTTVGGSLSQRSMEIFKEQSFFMDLIPLVETRKVILPTRVALTNKKALDAALQFEVAYILSKKEFSDIYINSEMNRLTQLEKRSA